MLSTMALLLIARQEWSPILRRRAGITWAVATVVLVIGLDRAYPAVQTNSAIAVVQRLGGRVIQNDNGIVVDLTDTTVDDDAFRRVAAKFEHLRPFGELRLANTTVTDRSLRLLPKFKTLKAVDVSGTKVTPGGVIGLRRALSGAEIVGDETPKASGGT
jgi:hypothetical protein